jgi:predicted nucleotide-binding protein
MEVVSKLKPLFASLRRLEISKYLESKEFSNFLLEKDADGIWDRCQTKVMLVSGSSNIDTAFMYLISEIYGSRFSFHKFLLAFLLDFAKWNSTKLDFTSVINNLKEIEIDTGTILSFVYEFRKIQNKKPFKTVDIAPKNVDDIKILDSKKIFIVHGHNEEMKQAVARAIEKLGLETRILHELPSQGKTIIEKLIAHSSEVSYAIILLSADDYGYSVKEGSAKKKLRARQNVILELGFFLGKLGRDKVIALFEVNENFDIPNDYKGVLYIPYDKGGKWKFEILKELNKSGFAVDANKLIY